MWENFSDPARGAILKAQELASQAPYGLAGAPHLFVAVLTESGGQGVVGVLLALEGVRFEEAELYGQSALAIPPEDRWNLSVNESWDRLMALAHEESRRQGQSRVELEHLFIASLRSPSVEGVLGPLGLQPNRLRRHLRGLNSSATPYRQGNPLNRLTEGAKKSVEAAHDAMRSSFCGRISTAHILLGVLADADNTAVETLLRAGVDVDELRAAARAQILSDGEIATPQKKFTGAAKRALERANSEAEKCQHSFIGPQHLLYSLLPHPTTIPENLAYGNSLDDPLEKVWGHFPVAEIERNYVGMWRTALTSTPHEAPERNKVFPNNQAKMDWRWGATGAVWPYFSLFLELNFELFIAGFGLAILVLIVAGILKVHSMWNMAGSFILGTLVGIPVGIILAFFRSLCGG